VECEAYISRIDNENKEIITFDTFVYNVLENINKKEIEKLNEIHESMNSLIKMKS